MRTGLAILCSLPILALSASAAASPAFPAAIQTKLGAPSEPSCAVCHEGGRGGMGTVTTAFGRAMMARGLSAGNVTALLAALDKMVADKVDSDRDGAPDVDELKAGKDPNGSTGIAVGAPPVEYGCGGATIARAHDDRAAALALAAFGVALLVRRTRRARRASGLGPLAVVSTSAALLGGCNPYEVSYVPAEVCPSGTQWTGGDSESELMNPGEACIACHSKGEGPKFAVAGTLFATSDAPDLCGGTNAGGAAVFIQGSDGKTLKVVPNEMGNFFSRLSVATPYKAWVATSDGKKREMGTPQTSGDCNGCHTSKGVNGAPGRIVLP